MGQAGSAADHGGKVVIPNSRRYAISVGLRAENQAACWIVAISAVLSLLLSPMVARPQGEASSPSAKLNEGAAEKSTTIDTVEVIARREAMRNAIVTFVSNMTRADGENLARWRDPVCPSVSGVTREQGEFVRSRILEIAASAAAPFNGNQKCRSNLFVILTPQPDQLWATWRARHPKMFGSELPQKIESLLDATRPVRAWQNAILNNADGTSPIRSSDRPPEYRLKDSRIASSVAEDISSVIVVVDTNGTGGATFGQLADYVAMVSLARIDLDADFASSSTILRLFAKSSSENAPLRLTNWDQAFLKGLYKTGDPFLRQRGLIATSMAQDLAP